VTSDEGPAGLPRASGRLGVGVVGAGRVGAVLASALRATGHAVVGASGVSDASRERIELLLPGVPRLEVAEVVPPRRARPPRGARRRPGRPGRRPRVHGAWQAGQLLVHTSGRFGTSVLAPATAAGAIGLAVHPR
jgi:predicted short-subunit dehydrogenase-like oxidoreductase (DUF2520 family)